MHKIRDRTATALWRRLRSLRAEVEQYHRDVDYWNKIHPEAPMEADPDGQMADTIAMLDRMEAGPPFFGSAPAGDGEGP